MDVSNLRFVKTFLVLAMTTISVVVITVFVSFYLRSERLTEDILLQQGRALFEQMIMTRRWISDHGGVYVKVREGIDPDPFLTTLPGLKVNVTDEDGSQYTMRNPGLVVRGISELAEITGTFRFHVASLNPINKKTNTPDSFERQALESFDKGEKESYAIEKHDDGSYYRYMAPLLHEERCDKCHAFQNHEIGDVLGGISVSIPMSMINEKMQLNRYYIAMAAAIVLVVLFLPLLVLSRQFVRRLNEAQSKLVTMATVDSLTGLFNRKVGMGRLDEEISQHRRFDKPLSLLMLDIDHFKSVNDTFGHQAGDAVLAGLSHLIRSISRKYDIACRYGGEEFMIVLPETVINDAVTVAEKLRQKFAEKAVYAGDKSIRATVSIGVSQMYPHKEERAEHIISRADNALYEAKKKGRNRTAVSPIQFSTETNKG